MRNGQGTQLQGTVSYLVFFRWQFCNFLSQGLDFGHEASQGREGVGQWPRGGGGSHDSGSLIFFSQLRSFNHSTSANHVKNMHNDAKY